MSSIIYTRQMNFLYKHNESDIVMTAKDKLTIFRTLVLFLEHHLIHSVEDESGSLKYCVLKKNINFAINHTSGLFKEKEN